MLLLPISAHSCCTMSSSVTGRVMAAGFSSLYSMGAWLGIWKKSACLQMTQYSSPSKSLPAISLGCGRGPVVGKTMQSTTCLS